GSVVSEAEEAGIDLERFAAEMDQLAAELHAAVNRPREVPQVEEEQSLSANAPLDPVASVAPLDPVAPLAPTASVDPVVLRATTAGATNFTSSAWDPFEDDLFEDLDVSSAAKGGTADSDKRRVSSKTIGGAVAHQPARGTSANRSDAGDRVAPSSLALAAEAHPAFSESVSDAGAVAEDAEFAGEERVLSMTGSHEALDLGDDEPGDVLDLDDSIDLRPRRDSGTLWKGPSIAEPVRSGEYSTPYSGEVSAEYDVPFEANPDRVSAGREFFRVLDTTVRILNLYEGKGKSSEQAVKTAYRSLGEFLERYPRVVVRVTPYEFMDGADAIYTSEEDRHGLTFRLFRDGVRELTLLRGVTEAELQGLLEILRLTSLNTEDDSVTLLWQKNLKHIEYRAVDTFLEGIVDADTGGAQAVVDELVAIADAPLHRGERIEGVDVRGLKPLPEALIATLAGPLSAEDPASIADRLEALDSDLWGRAIWICLHLIAGGDSDAG
ncbi:MAG: hypothetical protein KAI47_03170, partial [Deltaproteobacteria bacterium]|nr:hypothetical protein [Deltaproteobacteria bacterium]